MLGGACVAATINSHTPEPLWPPLSPLSIFPHSSRRLFSLPCGGLSGRPSHIHSPAPLLLSQRPIIYADFGGLIAPIANPTTDSVARPVSQRSAVTNGSRLFVEATVEARGGAAGAIWSSCTPAI